MEEYDGGRSHAINRHGWQVGTTDRPVLISDSSALDLPTLGALQRLGNDVVTLSDDGRTIAGYLSPAGEGESSTPVAVVWRCK